MIQVRQCWQLYISDAVISHRIFSSTFSTIAREQGIHVMVRDSGPLVAAIQEVCDINDKDRFDLTRAAQQEKILKNLLGFEVTRVICLGPGIAWNLSAFTEHSHPQRIDLIWCATPEAVPSFFNEEPTLWNHPKLRHWIPLEASLAHSQIPESVRSDARSVSSDALSFSDSSAKIFFNEMTRGVA